MSRGTANDEPVVSQANTAAFADGYARVFGERVPQRGRWVWDEIRGELVDAGNYRPPSVARNAPILADRLHEGTRSPVDGSDIGSRRKRREHARRHGVTDASDYGPGWRERTQRANERDADRKTDGAFEQAARKLYSQGKLR